MAAISKMRVLHLFDDRMELLDFETLGQLLQAPQSSSSGIEVQVGAMGGRVPARFATSWPRPHRLGFPTRMPLMAVAWIRRLLRDTRCDLVHAWGVLPAVAARLAGLGGRPLLATITHPLLEVRDNKWLLSARRNVPLPVACPTGAIRRDLVEKGHPPADAGIIRPGVDFGRIRAARRIAQRERLGLDPEQSVLITCPPPSREGGQYYAIWATALLEQIRRDLRLIVPGESKEQRRLRRFVRGFAKPHLYLFPDPSIDFVDLLAAADVCVAAAIGPLSTVALTWAMAANLPIVASAVPAVAELLVHNHNALLCRARQPKLLAARIRQLWRDDGLAYRLKDTARGQAYEVFSQQRMLQQYRQAYANLLAGKPAFEQITDAAVNL